MSDRVGVQLSLLEVISGLRAMMERACSSKLRTAQVP
jgi:hypothetical protein